MTTSSDGASGTPTTSGVGQTAPAPGPAPRGPQSGALQQAVGAGGSGAAGSGAASGGGVSPDMVALLTTLKDALLQGLGPRNAYRPKEMERVRGYALLATTLAGPAAPGRSTAARIVEMRPETLPTGDELTVVLENADPDGSVGFVAAGGGTVTEDPTTVTRKGALTELTVTVPGRAVSGPITVDTTSGDVTSSTPLTVGDAVAAVCSPTELYVPIFRRA